MSKLPGFPNIDMIQQGTPPNADIIQRLHDEVVSLCRRSYGAVNGLEIDGIICISILDTKEQQVVKIHKTLKSVFADTKKRQKKQKTEAQNPYWLHGTLENTGLSPQYAGKGPENFQSDIDALSNLLRDTNAAISKELSSAESVSKASKRKRRQPRQRVVTNVGAVGTEISTHTDNTEENIKTNKSPLNLPAEEDQQNAPRVNPFIHKDIVTVKEEKVDPEYDAIEQTQPKIVNVTSMCETDKDKTETNSVGMERKKVSTLIDSIIEKEIPREKRTPDKIENSQQGSFSDKEGTNETSEGDSSEFQSVEVKVEKLTDESEYGGSQECDQTDFTKTGYDYFGTGGSNSETENFDFASDYPPVGEIGRNALLEKLHEKGSMSHIGYPRERGRAERDPQGRSWIEMVKDNVNKYQAALERSGRGKSESENVPNSRNPASKIARGSSSLVALLKKPANFSTKSKELTTNAILDSAPCSRGPSVPKQDTDQISDRSSSNSPIVKIEVDEDIVHELYYQSNGEATGDPTYKQSGSEMPQENNGHNQKAPPGKLESKYPALFSHLQQAKQTNYDGQEQADSLVNRLPFISFQELFSQAATAASSPRLSESTTMQLLAQARINPYPSKEKGKTQRKVWHWKKRQVRPRDADGKIISPIPKRVKSPDSVRKKRFLGIPTSLRKTFSKRGSKSEQEEDEDWQPDVDNVDVDVDSDNNDNSPSNEEAAGTSGRRTRLSCGEKPRINFAELEVSDVEMEEDTETVEMAQASTLRKLMDTVNPLVYTDRQEDDNSAFPGGGSEQILAAFSASSEQLNSASSTASEQYKCSLCGLEFNQEYRWHYHLIKVHGITEEKVKLFR